MNGQCKEPDFLSDVAEHKMLIVRDCGANRHIRFRKPGTGIYGFSLITWPGSLCVTGSMGTYVFSRTTDMFTFFRQDPHNDERLHINPSYWGEKLSSIGTNEGYKEFDPDAFKERVREFFDDCKQEKVVSEEDARDLWDEISSSVLSCVDDGEHYAYAAVYEFEHEGFRFEDFFDSGGTERYTYHYIWNLYAIVWGIRQYDATRTLDRDKL